MNVTEAILVCSRALSNAAMATYSYFNKDGEYVDSFGWVPLLALINVSIMRSIALAPVIDAIASELYPTDIRYDHHKEPFLST